MNSNSGNVVTILSQDSDRKGTKKTAIEQEDPHKNKKRVVSVSLGELFAMELPVAEVLLAPWLRERSLGMIHAWRGVGKSHIALGIAYALASGTSFLYWKATKPTKVLYIDGEMQGSDIKQRLWAIHEAKNCSDTDPFKNLTIITPDIQPGEMLDLADPEWQASLDTEVENAALIIVDNLSCLARSGGKENDADSWEPVLQWALRMRREGKAVLFIHHSGKNGFQRGTSRREDALNTVIKLRNPPEYTPESGALFEVHFEKGRELFGDDAKPFEAQMNDDNGQQVWKTRPIEESNAEKIIEMKNLGLQPYEIAEELGVNKSTVSRALKAARAIGKLRDSVD